MGCGGSFMGSPLVLVMSQPQGRPLMLSAATSAPVNTPSTPGAALAASTLMLLILAWACGERTNTAWHCAASTTSSVYCPAPVRKR